MAALTPMMQQYMAIKEQYKDCILFYRLGDFYEMFYDDALTASRELEITLTGKNCGQEERAPMCGVPYHAVDVYLNKLVAKGYKVAICEQAEDPKQAKGIVKREVIRIVTPGTNLSQQALDEGLPVLCRADGGIHAEPPLVQQVLVGEHQVVGPGLAGDGKPLGLGGADEGHGLLGRDVADVIPAARLPH